MGRFFTAGLFTISTICFVSASDSNNSVGEAEPIEVEKEFSFQITPLHDRDYFTVTSPGDGVLTLELSKPLEEHTGIFPWWSDMPDDDGKAAVRRDGLWDIRAKKGKKVILGVRSSRSELWDKAFDEVIKARISYTPELPGDEPNDEVAQARDTQPGDPFKFRIAPQYDRDYFRLRSPGRGHMQFRLTSPSKEHPDFYVWWGESETQEFRSGIWDRRVDDGEEVVLGVRSSRSSTFERRSLEVLEGIVDFFPEHSPSEPNDTAEQAEEVSVGKEVSFTIMPRFDRDYFRLTSPGDGVLTFRHTTEGEEKTGLFPWWGEKKGDDGKLYENFSGEWQRPVEKGETIFCALRSASGSTFEVSSTKVQTGVFEFTPGIGTEPNDSAEEATLVEVGEPFSIQILPRFDRDYFKTVSPDSGTLRLTLTAPDGSSDFPYPWWGETTGEDGKLYEVSSGEWEVRVEKGQPVVLAFRSSRHSTFYKELPRIYEATLELISNDPSEPNNTPEQATEIEVGVPFESVMLPRTDIDYFSVISPGDGVIQIERDDDGTVIESLFVGWPTSEGSVLAAYDNRASKGEKKIFFLKSSQHSAFQIASETPVQLVARFIPEPRAPEPGDDRASSREVKVGDPFEFAMLPTWDADYIHFTPEFDGFVALELEVSPSKSLGVEWTNQDGEPITASSTRAVPVKAGEPVWLGLATEYRGWSSDEVFQGRIVHADPSSEPEVKRRRWSFPIQRVSEDE